ncbi:MAG: hypothetical protein KQH59_20405 [Desulfobulbaceae bacterium]|nr:hypothetical protein [Desulfobulbaceae bacterium]
MGKFRARKDQGKKINYKDRGDGSSDQIPPEKLPPIFSLRDLEKNYCVLKCELQDKAAFADTLRKISALTWAELKSNPRHSLGYEKISRSSLKVAVPGKISADVSFIAFRFSGKKAMVGYRDKEVFHILWLDRNFSVYNHE